MPFPPALLWSERQAHRPGFLRRELFKRIALDLFLPDDHQPKQPLRLLAHGLGIARALVARHRRGIHADFRAKIGAREAKVLPEETDLLRKQALTLLRER